MNMNEYYKAIEGIQRIKTQGGTAELSIAQIAFLIINLQDAKKNLPKDQFEEVYAIFQEMQQYTTKVVIDINGYLEIATQIIRRFDEVAPYEKYSGGDETECALMMEDIRSGIVDKKETDDEELDNIPPAGEILIRRITAICQKDKYIYRDLIIKNIDEIRVVLNNGKDFEEEKAAAYFSKMRDVYYSQVCQDFLEQLHQNVDPCIYERVLFAMKSPSICGLGDRDPDGVWMAGDIYAASYWAVTNQMWNDEEYIQITNIQNSIMEEAREEALRMMSD